MARQKTEMFYYVKTQTNNNNNKLFLTFNHPGSMYHTKHTSLHINQLRNSTTITNLKYIMTTYQV